MSSDVKRHVHRCSTCSRSAGDMCVVWRPPKDAELGSKLSWQNTGPYRVLTSQKHGREYRLQHLTTGDICIHSATDLHPYFVTQDFDSLTEEQKKERAHSAG